MEHETWAVWPWKAKISANHSLLNFLWSHRKGRTHKYWGNQSWGNTVWKCTHCRVRTPDIHVIMVKYHNIKKKKPQPLTQGNFRAGVLMKQAIFSNPRPCFASVRESWRRPSHRGPPSLVLCTAAPLLPTGGDRQRQRWREESPQPKKSSHHSTPLSSNYMLAITYFKKNLIPRILISMKSESHSVVSNSLQPHGLYTPWNSPGQNTGVGSLSLLQGIFPTQGLKPL